MSERLPPLTALRAFEAAARHMSFAKAADELHVTPAALSFQIKNLEEHLGHPVFHRLNRAVELTEAGRILAPGASEAFNRLESAWRATRKLQDNSALSVTAGPAFTAKILAPRLYDFARAHPEIELRFAASLRTMDFERDEIDVAVRYGEGPDIGLYSRTLLTDAVMPMMRPDLAERYKSPRCLIDAPLIYGDPLPLLHAKANWKHWFLANGIERDPPLAAQFSQPDHALDATLAGDGVVLGRSALATRYLASGQLVAPFKIALQVPTRFRFLCVEGNEKRPQIAAFEEWLFAEIGKLPDGTKGKIQIPIEDLM